MAKASQVGSRSTTSGCRPIACTIALYSMLPIDRSTISKRLSHQAAEPTTTPAARLITLRRWFEIRLLVVNLVTIKIDHTASRVVKVKTPNFPKSGCKLPASPNNGDKKPVPPANRTVSTVAQLSELHSSASR